MRAYVFPGQGIQKKGMGRTLFGKFPELCSQADQVLGYSIEQLCLQNPERRLSQTEYAQPAIYVVNALHYLTAREDLPPADYLAGHSLGEYSALFAAGAFDFETGLTLVSHRARLMAQADGGAMAAVVGASEEVVEQTLTAHDATGIVIANYNAPDQFVLSGGRDELERIKPVFEQLDGVRGFVPVRVSGAFHSPWMAEAAAQFRDFLAEADVREPTTPVISNATGRPFDVGTGGQAIREALAEQITKPVQWIECIRYLRNAGVSVFTELSETKVLTPLIDKIITAGEPPTDPRRDLITRIKREILQPEIGDAALDFDENTSFRQLGVNSIIYVRLARKAEAVLGVPLKPDVVYQNRSCAALADYLLSRDCSVQADPPPPASPAAPLTIAPTPSPQSPPPWSEYQDERVSALLNDCADGIITVNQAIEALRAGATLSSLE